MSGTGRSGRWVFDEQGNCRYVPDTDEQNAQNKQSTQSGQNGGWQTYNGGQQTYSTRQQWQRATGQSYGSSQQRQSYGGQNRYSSPYTAPQNRRHGNVSNSSRKQGDFWQWALIIALFVLFWPLGVVLLILKAKGLWGSGNSTGNSGNESWQNVARQMSEQAAKAGEEVRQGVDKARQAVESSAQTVKENARSAYQQKQQAYQTARDNACTGNQQKQQASQTARAREESSQQEKRAWKQWAKEHGLGHIGLLRTFGWLITGMFGISLLAELTSGAPELATTLVLLFFLAGGVCLLGAAGSRSGKRRRYLRYLTMIGSQEEVSVAAVAKTLGYRPKRVLKDFQNMLDCGVFERGYLDMERQVLVLREWTPGEQPEPAPKTEAGTANAEANASVAAIRKIREINNNIADPEMSAKIDQIEALTAKILRLLEENPDKAGELRSFLNYYLPETMNILERYAKLEAQGVERGNIAAAKQQIEDTTDKLVTAYETQLDKLFESDVLDISADLKVMETMLEKDGLTEDGLHL